MTHHFDFCISFRYKNAFISDDIMRFFVLVLTLLCLTSLARADDFTISITPGFSTSFTAMTNYIVRGQTQTRGRPAATVTGSYGYNGFFVTAGVINSKQGNNNFEADLTLGYRTTLSDSWFYQASVVYQSYPGASGYNNLSTVELQNILNYVQDWGKLIAAFAIQPQGQGHAGFYTYTSVGADFNLPYDFTFGTRIGWNTSANHAAAPNYVDWTATLSRPITKQISWTVQYTGTSTHRTGYGNAIVGMINVSF
jgi:uncharacterized protein (TIGR02001 family)